MVSGGLRLRPGALVVLEGLDRTGKSTQMNALKDLPWSDPKPTFTHMPSGMTRLTESIYTLTEREPISSPLARQLLHLACHAENSVALAESRGRGGLVLDRWWWSTVAYGWHAGHLADAGVDEAAFFGMIDAVWSRQQADVVFLFHTPYARDDLNRDEVREGYARLAATYPDLVVEIPAALPVETTDFLTAQLRERGLLLSDS